MIQNQISQIPENANVMKLLHKNKRMIGIVSQITKLTNFGFCTTLGSLPYHVCGCTYTYTCSHAGTLSPNARADFSCQSSPGTDLRANTKVDKNACLWCNIIIYSCTSNSTLRCWYSVMGGKHSVLHVCGDVQINARGDEHLPPPGTFIPDLIALRTWPNSSQRTCLDN